MPGGDRRAIVGTLDTWFDWGEPEPVRALQWEHQIQQTYSRRCTPEHDTVTKHETSNDSSSADIGPNSPMHHHRAGDDDGEGTVLYNSRKKVLMQKISIPVTGTDTV